LLPSNHAAFFTNICFHPTLPPSLPIFAFIQPCCLLYHYLLPSNHAAFFTIFCFHPTMLPSLPIFAYI